MKTLISLINEFWHWSGLPESGADIDIRELQVDPLHFPKFDEMRTICKSMINATLTVDEMLAFLTCMALDSEEERILDDCKTLADTSFLYALISIGVTHPQSEARWQLSELLRKPVPERDSFLHLLSCDSNKYVRKRANNVINSIQQERDAKDH